MDASEATREQLSSIELRWKLGIDDSDAIDELARRLAEAEARAEAAESYIRDNTRLREQLRIAREGLVSVTDYYDTSRSCCDGGYEDGYNTGRYEACKIARELLDQMEQEARNDQPK
jgi:hypothetical protein